jgi:hypothetical protein
MFPCVDCTDLIVIRWWEVVALFGCCMVHLDYIFVMMMILQWGFSFVSSFQFQFICEAECTVSEVSQRCHWSARDEVFAMYWSMYWSLRYRVPVFRRSQCFAYYWYRQQINVRVLMVRSEIFRDIVTTPPYFVGVVYDRKADIKWTWHHLLLADLGVDYMWTSWPNIALVKRCSVSGEGSCTVWAVIWEFDGDLVG